jgi:hypothetical protein
MRKIRRVAEVQRRMCIENLQAAQEQDRQADNADPVRDANDGGMSVDESPDTMRFAGIADGMVKVCSHKSPGTSNPRSKLAMTNRVPYLRLRPQLQAVDVLAAGLRIAVQLRDQTRPR